MQHSLGGIAGTPDEEEGAVAGGQAQQRVTDPELLVPAGHAEPGGQHDDVRVLSRQSRRLQVSLLALSGHSRHKV